MAVLITGAQGFVGARLVALLKEQGREVVLFDSDIADCAAVLDWPTDKKIDAVVHLAAVVNARSRRDFEKVNIEGTRNIVELAKRLGASRLIFMSSLRVLSKQSVDPYINSKRAGEKMVIDSGLPYVILRPSMVYGPGDSKNIGWLVRLAKTWPIVPVFNFRMQPIFVDDVATALAVCLELPIGQTINLAGLETISFLDILKELKQLGVKVCWLNMPRFFGALLKIISFLPGSPWPRWQVETLLSDEIYEDFDWPVKLGLKPVSFGHVLGTYILHPD